MVPNFAFKKSFDSSTQQWCVAPNLLQTQNLFLVLCDSEQKADEIFSGLTQGKLEQPSESSRLWNKIGNMPNPQKTPIFSPNF